MRWNFASQVLKPVPFRTEKTVCFHGDVANFRFAKARESSVPMQSAIRGAGSSPWGFFR